MERGAAGGGGARERQNHTEGLPALVCPTTPDPRGLPCLANQPSSPRLPSSEPWHLDAICSWEHTASLCLSLPELGLVAPHNPGGSWQTWTDHTACFPTHICLTRHTRVSTYRTRRDVTARLQLCMSGVTINHNPLQVKLGGRRGQSESGALPCPSAVTISLQTLSVSLYSALQASPRGVLNFFYTKNLPHHFL